MRRAIVGFHRDEEGDWAADLDCGHAQHTRHRPPFVNRPWVVSAAGRESMLGRPLDCLRCDRMEWPEGFEIHRRTPDFDERSVPAALLADHSTKRGTWARIHVLAGTLHYHVGTPIERSMRVEASGPAIIVPEVPHRVEPDGPVRFFVEFHRRRK